MKCSIRVGVFETNSSSVHGVCVTNDNLYHDFMDGKVIVSSNLSDEVLNEIGLDRNKSYDPLELIDRLKNDESFRKLLDIDSTMLHDVDVIGPYHCTSKELLFYHGLWTLDGLKDSEYSYMIDENAETPNGENVVIIGYFGWG